MSSLTNVCGNCYSAGKTECLPAHIPMPDFSKIDRELAKLDAQEEAVDAQEEADEKAIEAAQERLRAARAKKRRLRRQRKFLKRREVETFEAGRVDAEELEQLEMLERLNQDLASVNPEAPAEAHIVDWSAFWPEAHALSGELVEASL
jgi:chromosome segregation ATPase